MAITLNKARHFKESCAMFKDNIALSKVILGEYHPDTIASNKYYIKALRMAGE
jgi:hypothetical protein